MTPAQRAAFGITEDQESEFSEWVEDRVGFVLGADGRGGSGVFVEAPDGRTALLTARHVLIPSIVSGELTVAHFRSGSASSVEPSALRMASRADAALIYVDPSMVVPARLALADWDPRVPCSVAKGQGVVSAGAPGMWKSPPDLAARSIQSMRVLFYWTAVTDPNEDGLVVCDVDETDPELPPTLGGVSGGPVFDLERRLVGLNVHETLPNFRPPWNLYAAPRAKFEDLRYPFELPADAPTDYTRQICAVKVDARRKRFPDDPVVPVLFTAEFFWSLSQPTHRYGQFGRVVCVVFGASEASLRYRVNAESIFFLPEEHDQESRNQALEQEAAFFIQAMGYEGVRP